MDDAKYFRAQAELSLEIARQLSDPVAAKRVRLTAADYLAKAEQLERTGHNGVAIIADLSLPINVSLQKRGADLSREISHEAAKQKKWRSKPRQLAWCS